jgi:hypothetical protein
MSASVTTKTNGREQLFGAQSFGMILVSRWPQTPMISVQSVGSTMIER